MKKIINFWQKALWSKLILIVGGLFFFFIILGLLSPKGQESYQKGYESGQKATQLIFPTDTPTFIIEPTEEPLPTEESTLVPKKISYRLAGTWTTDLGGETWKAIIVPKGISREDIIRLAEEIHTKDPEVYYEIFDDTTELSAYMKWSKSDNAPEVYFPEDWVMDHGIGIINKMLTTSGTRWQFYSDHSEYQATIDLE